MKGNKNKARKWTSCRKRPAVIDLYNVRLLVTSGLNYGEAQIVKFIRTGTPPPTQFNAAAEI